MLPVYVGRQAETTSLVGHPHTIAYVATGEVIGETVPQQCLADLNVALIVDDEEGTLLSFTRMLRLQGYAVFTADNADEGLREAARCRPDAILFDLRMPLVDGLSLLRRGRADETLRDTQVTIVTGDYFVEDTVGAERRALGAQIEFKPLWLEDLVAVTRRRLTGREALPRRRV